MSVSGADSGFTTDDDGRRYHAVSGWAILTLILGLLSPLAFIGPPLWLIPIACIIVAIVAMRRIRGSAGELVGWNLALLGLLLALLFGAAAPMRTFARAYWLEKRAEIVTDQYIDLLLQGRPFAAYQLTLAPALRRPLDVEQTNAYEKDARGQQKYDNFLKSDTVKTLLGKNNQVRIEPLASKIFPSDDGSDHVIWRIKVASGNESSPETHIIDIETVREITRKGEQFWLIYNTVVKT